MSAGLIRFAGVPEEFAAGFTTLEAGVSDAAALGRHLAVSLGVPDAEVARLKQVHGRRVVALDANVEASRDHVFGEGDALITRHAGRLLTIASADCTPVLLVEEKTGLIAAVHAGWRGTAQRIVTETIAELKERGVTPSDLLAFVGPCISRERYEVGPEVITALRDSHVSDPVPAEAVRAGTGDRSFVDVAAFSRAELLAAGVRAERIVEAGLCTAARPDLFPSYRRDGSGTGRVLTGIVRR